MSDFGYGDQVRVVGNSIKAGRFGLIRDVAPSGHLSDLTEWDGWDEDGEGE